MNRLALLGVAVGTLIALALILPSSSARADGPQSVTVTNWPNIQHVFVDNSTLPVYDKSARPLFAARREIVVNPAPVEQTTQWIDAGVIDANEHSEAIISLLAQPTASVERAGTLGLVLLPEVEDVKTAFERHGLALLSIQAGVTIPKGDANWVASNPMRVSLAFQRYHAYFYNTSSRNLSVTLYTNLIL